MKPITPRPPEWVDTAPVRIVVTREVPAPPDQVFAVIADHEAWPTWFEVLQEVEVPERGEGVGGGRRVHLPGMVFDEEFTEWVPGEVFAFTVTHMSRPLLTSLAERVRLTPVGEGRTRVEYVQGFEPKTWARPLLALARSRMRKGLEQGLDGLAARVAAQPGGA